MEIFSNEIASTLQYFTFPLEVVGLTLATIEVRFPLMARQISEWVARHESSAEVYTRSHEQTGIGAIGVRFESLLENLINSWAVKLPDRLQWSFKVNRLPAPKWYVRATYVITFVIIAMLAYLVYSVEGTFNTRQMYILGSAVVIAVVGYTTLALLRLLIQFSDNFVEGRAVGTLGC